jgi:hypothetical protein
VTADLACAIADGSEAISDFRVLTDQKELFGLVASVPTTWRTLDEIAAGGPQALTRITRAVNGARRQAWAAIEARQGALPGVRIADKVLEGVTCIRLDATVTPALRSRTGTGRFAKVIWSRSCGVINCRYSRAKALKISRFAPDAHMLLRSPMLAQSHTLPCQSGIHTSTTHGPRSVWPTSSSCPSDP